MPTSTETPYRRRTPLVPPPWPVDRDPAGKVSIEWIARFSEWADCQPTASISLLMSLLLSALAIRAYVVGADNGR